MKRFDRAIKVLKDEQHRDEFNDVIDMLDGFINGLGKK